MQFYIPGAYTSSYSGGTLSGKGKVIILTFFFLVIIALFAGLGTAFLYFVWQSQAMAAASVSNYTFNCSTVSIERTKGGFYLEFSLLGLNSTFKVHINSATLEEIEEWMSSAFWPCWCASPDPNASSVIAVQRDFAPMGYGGPIALYAFAGLFLLVFVLVLPAMICFLRKPTSVAV